MSIDQPRLPEILEAHSDRRERAIKKILPGEIVSYSSETGRANVQPVITDEGETVAVLEDVPVIWPGSSASYVASKLVAGDRVVILNFDQDPSVWLEGGSGVTDPVLKRRHSYYPVVLPVVSRPDGYNAEASTEITMHGTTKATMSTTATSIDIAQDESALTTIHIGGIDQGQRLLQEGAAQEIINIIANAAAQVAGSQGPAAADFGNFKLQLDSADLSDVDKTTITRAK